MVLSVLLRPVPKNHEENQLQFKNLESDRKFHEYDKGYMCLMTSPYRQAAGFTEVPGVAPHPTPLVCEGPWSVPLSRGLAFTSPALYRLSGCLKVAVIIISQNRMKRSKEIVAKTYYTPAPICKTAGRPTER